MPRNLAEPREKRRIQLKKLTRKLLQASRMSLATIAMLQFSVAGPLAGTAQAHDDKGKARTPIKHVIVIVGENRTFDHIFATYEPVSRYSVNNLLPKAFTNPDGPPGPNYSSENQYPGDATDTHFFHLP